MKLAKPLHLSLTALLLASAVCAQAEEIFERKAGYWQITIEGDKASPLQSVSELCLGADTDAKMAVLAKPTMAKLCSKQESHRVGSEYVMDSVCSPLGRPTKSHSVTTPTADGGYRMVITGDNPMGAGQSTTVQVGRWLGACPAGMKPGDQVVRKSVGGPVIMRHNLLDVMARP